jgi:predicted dehydrogenase
LKFLIAGLGSIGRRHFRNLLALGEHDIVLYRTHLATLPDDEDGTSHRLTDFPVETNLQAALAHRPDAVIVSNPTALHLDVAIPAVEAGCHILLEKPISHSLERVDELRAVVTHGGSKILVGFQFRFHPGLQRVRQLLVEEAIGNIVSARAHWGEYLPDWHPWEDYRLGYAARPELGGGAVLTLCHPLDYLRWLLGECQVSWAMLSTNGLGLPVEDTAEIGLKFASGAIGSVHLDYVQRPPRHTLEIVGTRGTIRWDNADGEAQLYRASSLVGDLPTGEGQGGGWQTFPAPTGFERNRMFLDEIRNFIAVMRGEAEPVCTLDDGIRALELALAVRQSAVL